MTEEKSLALGPIARAQIERSFLPEYQATATEQQGLGIAIARHFNHNILAIMETFYAALEDANAHEENKTVARWIGELEK